MKAFSEIVCGFFSRLFAGILGIVILRGIYLEIFINHQIPLGDGRYRLLLTPVAFFFGIAFLVYAVGGQDLLSKVIPTLAEKRRDKLDSHGISDDEK